MKKEKTFSSKPAGRFYVIFSLFGFTALGLIVYGIYLFERGKSYGILKDYNTIPFFVAGIILILLVKMIFDCYGNHVTITPQLITFQRKDKKIALSWKEMRSARTKKIPPFYTALILRDQEQSFEIHDIAFPDFPFIVEVVQFAIKTTREEGYKI
jgi:hypothetical protein